MDRELLIDREREEFSSTDETIYTVEVFRSSKGGWRPITRFRGQDQAERDCERLARTYPDCNFRIMEEHKVVTKNLVFSAVAVRGSQT